MRDGLTGRGADRGGRSQHEACEPSSLQSGPLTFGYGMTAAGNVETVQDGATTWRYVYDFRDRLVSSSPAGGASEDVIHKYATIDVWPYPAGDRLKQSGVQRAGAFVTTQSYGYDHQTNVSAVTSWSSSGQVTGGMCLRHDALGRLALVGARPRPRDPRPRPRVTRRGPPTAARTAAASRSRTARLRAVLAAERPADVRVRDDGRGERGDGAGRGDDVAVRVRLPGPAGVVEPGEAPTESNCSRVTPRNGMSKLELHWPARSTGLFRPKTHRGAIHARVDSR